MASKDYLSFHPNPEKPALLLPKGACNSNCHVFGPKRNFPYAAQSSYVLVDAPKETLFQRHRLLGVDRAVVAQASCNGTDNSAMLEAITTGGDNYCGVAIVSPDITYQELEMMHEHGVRGVRFNFVKRLKACQPEAARQLILAKISEFSWHSVVYFAPENLPKIRDFLLSIKSSVIIDHMGRVPVENGIHSSEFQNLTDLLSNENFWVKISGSERLSKQGPPYHDADDVVRELISLFPDRVLWGTDWPHPNMKSHIPDDGLLVDKLALVCPDLKFQKILLIDNPDKLYWSN